MSFLKETLTLILKNAKDLSLQISHVLREHDSNCAKYFDRNILQQIRMFTVHDDTARREKWLAKAFKNMHDIVKRLEAHSEEFLDSWDALILFAGL